MGARLSGDMTKVKSAAVASVSGEILRARASACSKLGTHRQRPCKSAQLSAVAPVRSAISARAPAASSSDRHL